MNKKTKKKSVTLPDKPSELLMIALTDLEKVERLPNVFVRMSSWLIAGDRPGVCKVCAAGAVMYQSMGCTPQVDEGGVPGVGSFDFGIKTNGKLKAINWLRRGNLGSAFECLGRALPAGLPHHMTEDDGLDSVSETDRPTWKLHMQDLIGILQAEGY